MEDPNKYISIIIITILLPASTTIFFFFYEAWRKGDGEVCRPGLYFLASPAAALSPGLLRVLVILVDGGAGCLAYALAIDRPRSLEAGGGRRAIRLRHSQMPKRKEQSGHAGRHQRRLPFGQQRHSDAKDEAAVRGPSAAQSPPPCRRLSYASPIISRLSSPSANLPQRQQPSVDEEAEAMRTTAAPTAAAVSSASVEMSKGMQQCLTAGEEDGVSASAASFDASMLSDQATEPINPQPHPKRQRCSNAAAQLPRQSSRGSNSDGDDDGGTRRDAATFKNVTVVAIHDAAQRQHQACRSRSALLRRATTTLLPPPPPPSFFSTSQLAMQGTTSHHDSSSCSNGGAAWGQQSAATTAALLPEGRKRRTMEQLSAPPPVGLGRSSTAAVTRGLCSVVRGHGSGSTAAGVKTLMAPAAAAALSASARGEKPKWSTLQRSASAAATAARPPIRLGAASPLPPKRTASVAGPLRPTASLVTPYLLQRKSGSNHTSTATTTDQTTAATQPFNRLTTSSSLRFSGSLLPVQKKGEQRAADEAAADPLPLKLVRGRSTGIIRSCSTMSSLSAAASGAGSLVGHRSHSAIHAGKPSTGSWRSETMTATSATTTTSAAKGLPRGKGARPMISTASRVLPTKEPGDPALQKPRQQKQLHQRRDGSPARAIVAPCLHRSTTTATATPSRPSRHCITADASEMAVMESNVAFLQQMQQLNQQELSVFDALLSKVAEQQQQHASVEAEASPPGDKRSTASTAIAVATIPDSSSGDAAEPQKATVEEVKAVAHAEAAEAVASPSVNSPDYSAPLHAVEMSVWSIQRSPSKNVVVVVPATESISPGPSVMRQGGREEEEVVVVVRRSRSWRSSNRRQDEPVDLNLSRSPSPVPLPPSIPVPLLTQQQQQQQRPSPLSGPYMTRGRRQSLGRRNEGERKDGCQRRGQRQVRNSKQLRGSELQHRRVATVSSPFTKSHGSRREVERDAVRHERCRPRHPSLLTYSPVQSSAREEWKSADPRDGSIASSQRKSQRCLKDPSSCGGLNDAELSISSASPMPWGEWAAPAEMKNSGSLFCPTATAPLAALHQVRLRAAQQAAVAAARLQERRAAQARKSHSTPAAGAEAAALFCSGGEGAQDRAEGRSSSSVGHRGCIYMVTDAAESGGSQPSRNGSSRRGNDAVDTYALRMSEAQLELLLEGSTHAWGAAVL